MSGWQVAGQVLMSGLPLVGMFVVLVGSIMTGFATPSGLAALGWVATVVAVAAYRRLRWRDLLLAVRETAQISVMILFIIVASTAFSQILAFSGAANGLLRLIGESNSSALAVLVGMLLILLFLGAFMDQVSMMMITVPFFIPLASSLGIDLIWLSVLMLIVMEVSFTTPPFGLLLYVMKGVAPPETSIQQIYLAALPFIILELFVLALLMAFPILATGLPDLMTG